MTRVWWVAFAAAAMLACKDNPNINGAKVTPLGASPTCVDVCARFAALCGFAPTGDGCTTDAGDGYCDNIVAIDEGGAGSAAWLACVGQATSCEQSWATTDGGCAPLIPTPAVADAGTTDDGSSDASDDAASE